jgi:5-methylcytosine-specific restriction endonuclease McrBC regulatory subunit McrC
MLEKVFRINLFNLNYSHSRNDGLDLLYLVFPYFLKKALRQGLLRKYQTYKRNDSAVKGVIDISRHIKYNTPFNGKIAYNYREYSADNHVTQLIRHTIEFLKQKPIGKNILSNDSDTVLAVKQITEVTQETYSFHAREKIIHKNLKGENHPYYSDYKPLQKLCVMILNHSRMQYSQSNSPVYGILFDGAWLWEEYLATILKPVGFEHPENKTGKGGIKLFDNSKNDDAEIAFSKCYRRIYPDFYRENTKSENDDFLKNDGVILDAKYKQLEKGLVRDDLYQIISYMHTMKIPTGGFIYPLPFSSAVLTDRSSITLTDRSDEDETLLPSEVKTRLLSDVEVKNYKLANDTGTVSTIAFPIPQHAENYKEFVETMKESESNLLEKMRQNKL